LQHAGRAKKDAEGSVHELDTRYAFTDRVLIGDREAVRQFQFGRTPEEEAQADQKAVALLQKSPYKDKLQIARS
jgi:hypothetical protein